MLGVNTAFIPFIHFLNVRHITTDNHSDGWFMGMTKDWISGAWVGADDRSVHFRTGVLGEGARTALPIYGRFIEKVYKDKSIGITMGYFPKPKIKIRYNCKHI
mgnify:CR=1 FL=1